MSASTPGEDTFTEAGKKPDKQGSGLVAGHAYTLLGAKAVSTGQRYSMFLYAPKHEPHLGGLHPNVLIMSHITLISQQMLF